MNGFFSIHDMSVAQKDVLSGVIDWINFWTQLIANAATDEDVVISMDMFVSGLRENAKDIENLVAEIKGECE